MLPFYFATYLLQYILTFFGELSKPLATQLSLLWLHQPAAVSGVMHNVPNASVY